MNKQSITFSASEQTLEKTGGIDNYASNIVSYVEATFTLGENWTGYDVVRAVWESAYAKISTVLDSDHKCVVPAEVLRHKSKVNVNLVGSIVTNDVLTDRLTTYPVHAITVDADARVDSTETQPITPSQFEQFVEAVHADAESIQDYSYDSEAWAKGTRGGVAVPSTDPTYHNNSKYYADQGAELEQEVSDLKSDLTQETNARIVADNVLSARITDNDTDISALQTSVTNLGIHKVAQPLDGNNQPTNGTSGQSLRTKGDGTTEWASVGLPTDEQTAQAVSDWLDEHPEATTTVQDWSLSYKKLEKGTLGFVTPEMYGAVGDGVADDIIAIRTAIQSGKPVYFSNSYYISEPITLVNGAALIGGETYDYIINLKTSAGAFIIPDNVRAVTIKGFHCQAKNNNETLLDINASSTRHIHIEGVRADNYNKGIYITGTLWDSTFKNMRIESNTSATDLYVETNHNCFNVLFESVYFSGGGIINVNSYSGSFKNCNFGLFQDNQIRFTAKSNILFISCNLECEQFLTNAIPIRLGTGRFTIEGCSFIENGDSSSAMIRTSSSTWLLKITNCVESIKSESSTMTIVPADYLELAYAGSFQADDEFINIEYSGAYSRFSPIYPAGIPKGADNNHYPRGTMRYNPDLEEIQYTADGDNWIDALGNTNDGSTVIKLGNGWYLEFGQITITGDVATILYSRQRDGYVFVSIPETDFVGGIMNRIDVNDRAGTYCIVRCLMYDSYNKVWVPNQKTYKLYWAKISN